MESTREVDVLNAKVKHAGKPIISLAYISKLAFVDSLRGVAILMVILVHTAQSVPGLGTLINQVAEYGQMGVQLFFILSAYTICLSLDRRKNESKPILSFYIRRYFRIAPLYYCGIILYFLLNLVLGSGSIKNYTVNNIMANVLFYHGFYQPGNNNIVYGGWSIGAEMAFYVIVPLLFSAIKRFRNSKPAILMIPVISLLLSLLSFQLLSSLNGEIQIAKGNFYYYNLLNQLPVFLIGISYYFFEKHLDLGTSISSALNIFSFLLLTALSIYLFHQNLNATLIPFLTGITFIFLINTFKSSERLNWRVLQRIGQLSFSIYIFHFVFAWYGSEFLMKHFLKDVFPPELNLVICYALTLLMSTVLAVLSERTIERAGINIGKSLIARI